MLSAIRIAIDVKGRKNTSIAYDLGKTAHTIGHWFSGRQEIPIRCRRALMDAIGAPIDWDAYQMQFEAFQATRPAKPAPLALPPALPLDDTEDAPPPAPVMPPPAPIAAPQVPARRLTATPPAKHAQTRRSAPVAPSTPKRSIFSGFFDPNDNGMKFE